MNKLLKISPVENEIKSRQAKRVLIDYIVGSGEEKKVFKLPSEGELSQQLGISRNVLRDALMSLEEMGIVTRRRSKGTMANPKIAQEIMRLDINPELSRMMEEFGFQLKVETLRLSFVFERDAGFGAEQENYLGIEKLFYGDGVPMVYCVDRIAGSYAAQAEDYIMELKTMSHYTFLEKYCDTTMAYTMASLDAGSATPQLAALLGVKVGSPLIQMDDYVYNYDHEVVVHSTIYYRSGQLNLKLLRKSW